MAVVHAPDLDLHPQADGTATADTGAIRATLAGDLAAAELLRVDVQGYLLRYATGDATWVDLSGTHQVLFSVASAPVVINGSIASYAPTMAPYVVEYQVEGSRVKRSVTIMQSLPAPDPAVFSNMEAVYLAVHGPLTVPAGLSVVAEGQAFAGDMWTADQLRLVDGNGKTVMVLERVWGKTATGHVCAGRYRLVTDPITGALQIYELLPWWWIRTLTAEDYPLVVDPTVGTTSAVPEMPSNSRPYDYLADGTMIAVYPNGTDLLCSYLPPGTGTSWTAPTSGATVVAGVGGSVFAGVNVKVVNDVIYVLARTSGASESRLFRGVKSDTTATWTSITFSSTYSYYYPDLTGAVRNDGKTQLLLTWGSNMSGDSPSIVGCQVTDNAGTMTATAISTYINFVSVTTSSKGACSIAQRPDKSLVLLGVTVNQLRGAVATWDGSTWTVGASSSLATTGVSSEQGGISAVATSTGDVYLAWRFNSAGSYTGKVYKYSPWTDMSYPADNIGSLPPALAIDRLNNLYVWTYVGGAIVRRRYPGTSWDTAATIETTTVQRICSGRGGASQANLDVLYVKGTTNPYTLQHDRLVTNVAPNEPTITVASAFHAASGVTVTVTLNDPDPGDTLAGVYLKRTYGSTTEWWNGTAWVTSEPGTPIAATGTSAALAITTGWVSGTTYQLYAATVDASGAKGPYNSTPVLTKASTKPAYTQTSPTSGGTVNSSKTRIQGSMTCASGVTPASYIVSEYAADGTSVLNGPTTVTSTGGLDYTLQYVQSNATSYQTGVIPVDSDGVRGDEVKTPIATSFTPCNTPTIVAVPEGDQFPPRITVTVTNPAGGTTVDHNRIERSTDNANWTELGTCTANGSYTDYSPASDQTYYYRAVAVGDNSTEANSTAKVAVLSRECWWFVPIGRESESIPFSFNREASWQHDREFTEVTTRGPDTVHFFGGKKRDVVNISATYVGSEFASPHASIILGVEEWRQRFIDLVGVKGYLHSPQGFTRKGILEPPQGQFIRDMITNPITVNVRFVQKGEVP